MIKFNDEFLKRFKATNGALSVTEATAIANLTEQVPEGVWLELGVHLGKSAMAAAYGGECVGFELVEPEFEKSISTQDVAANIGAFSKAAIRLAFIVGYSTDYLKGTNQMYSYVMLDSGDHGEELVNEEVRLLEDRIVSGGILAFHDFGNQFTAVARGYDYLLGTGKYEVVPIDWAAIFEYVKENNLEDGNTSWHLYPELPHPPNFVGALKRK